MERSDVPEALAPLAEVVNDLVGRVEALERALQGSAFGGEQAESAPPPPPPPLLAGAAPADAAADAALTEELEALRAKHAKLVLDYERIEGEHQALKLRLAAREAEGPASEPAAGEARAGGTATARLNVELAKLRVQHAKLQSAYDQLMAQGTEGAPPVEPGAGSSEEVAQLREELEELRRRYEELGATSEVHQEIQRRQKAEEELSRVKREATRRIHRLKEDVDTTKKQKDNLLKELASRDVGGGGGELTLEQITNSPVFKTMLGNIRRTSREEVTLLHDAVVALGKIDPDAYNKLLDVAAAKFKAVNVENPLALLPKLPAT